MAKPESEDVPLAQHIISVAEEHDLPTLEALLGRLKSLPVPSKTLHAALTGCGRAEDGEASENAVETVKLLLEQGASWNTLNAENETPGCTALRLGQLKIYDLIVEAGFHDPGCHEKIQALSKVPVDNAEFLSSRLRWDSGMLVDDSGNVVMMAWEVDIQTRHAASLIPGHGLKVMNVGFGMGIVDAAIQSLKPAQHYIVEAHPQVLHRLREEGWYDKPGVIICQGRWQDMLLQLAEKSIHFDAIYYDTYGEGYAARKEFIHGCLKLLAVNGRLGWFNWIGADRQVFYDIYKKIAEKDLNEMGLGTTWEEIKIPRSLHQNKELDDIKLQYMSVDVYRMPVNMFLK